MARYIDADKIISHLNDEIEACGDVDINCYPINYGTYLGLKSSKSFVETAETADVQEVRHSSWKCANVRMSSRDVNCRYCHRTETISNGENFEYCPHCGAKMDGDDDEAKNKEIEEEK